MPGENKFEFYNTDTYVEFSVYVREGDSEAARNYLDELLGIKGSGARSDYYLVSSAQYRGFRDFLKTRQSYSR